MENCNSEFSGKGDRTTRGTSSEIPLRALEDLQLAGDRGGIKGYSRAIKDSNALGRHQYPDSRPLLIPRVSSI